ncbi:MAG: portal protein, partial [Alphaproteobacteria bacterium]
IKLVPGAIIPKAVGSAGLTPLNAPGRFDVSELVLDKLRASIRRALLADKLGQIEAPKMTATEVLERSAEMARLLGATYGRLQSELLMPLVTRSLAIMARRGEIDDIRIDGRTIDLEYRSPLARQNKRQEAQGALQWLDAIRALGPEALATVDQQATARWLARAFNVPQELVRESPAELPGEILGLGEDVLAEMSGLVGGAPVDAVIEAEVENEQR